MASVLKISEATALGVHACVAAARGGGAVSAAAMAGAFHASQAHLAKVTRRLVNSGILLSSRGPGGGFILARAPEEITLLDIYEAIEGKLPDQACLFLRPACDDTPSCPIHSFLEKINREVRDYFATATLAKLAKPTKECQSGQKGQNISRRQKTTSIDRS